MQLQTDGKRQGLRSLVAVSAGTSTRLLIRDTLSGREFLCDNGAQTSVLPATVEDTAPGVHGPQLRSANDAPIRTYGTKTADLCFGGQRFRCDFFTADISFTLLGADFLCAHNLLVGIKNNRLVDARTFSSFACARGRAAYGGLSSSLSEGDEYQQLLRKFTGINRPTSSAVTAKHGVEHHIDTKGPPVYARALTTQPRQAESR